MPDYGIRLSATNNASPTFNTVARDAQKMGSTIAGAAKQSKNELTGVGTGAKSMAGTLSKAGADGSRAFGGVVNSLKGLRNDIKAVDGDAKALGGSFDGLKSKIGGAIALGGLNALSNSLVNNGKEAGLLGAKLESLMKGAGVADATGKVKELGNSLAALTGGDDDEIAKGLGQAIASGKLRSLQEYGIFLNDAEQASIKAAAANGEFAESQARVAAVTSATQRQIALLTESTPESIRQVGEFGVAWGNSMETIGTGSTNARASWQAAITPILNGLQANHEGLLENIGATIEYGTVAANATAPIWGLASGVMEVKNALALSKIAKAADVQMTGAATIATNVNTAAVVANGNAAIAAALKHRALGAARLLGVGAVGVGLGVLGYEGLRATGALGDDAPGAGEAAGNAAGRIGAFFSSGRSSAYDDRVRGEAAEEGSAAIMARMKERSAIKGIAAIASSSAPTLPNFGSALRAGASADGTVTVAPVLAGAAGLGANVTRGPGDDPRAKLAALPKGAAFNERRQFYQKQIAGQEADARRAEVMSHIAAIVNGQAQAFFSSSPTNQQEAQQSGQTRRQTIQARPRPGQYNSKGEYVIKFDDITLPREISNPWGDMPV